MEIHHDTPLLIDQIGRFLPVRRCRATIYRWMTRGQQRRDLLWVKLESFDHDGARCTTLENYWKMQLRLDASRIVRLDELPDGVDLCLAMCGACEKFVRFEVKRNSEDRGEKLRTLPAGKRKWRQFDDYTWLCEKCGN